MAPCRRTVRYNVDRRFPLDLHRQLLSVPDRGARPTRASSRSDQLLDEAQAPSPARLTYGSAGIGSILHSTVELLANQTKTEFLHVPYRGEAPAITALLGGEFDFIAATTGPITPLIKAGKLRALAVTARSAGAIFPMCRRR